LKAVVKKSYNLQQEISREGNKIMSYREYNADLDDTPSPKFLVDQHWWILKSIIIDEQGRVCKIKGQFSEENPEHKTFELSQVRNTTEIALTVLVFEQNFRGSSDDELTGYDPRFADGHKPNCPMAKPEFRAHNPEIQAIINKKLKMKPSNVVKLCRCETLSAI
jgi:hypothetical protein